MPARRIPDFTGHSRPAATGDPYDKDTVQRPITKSLLFKAFETCADGVALLGCEPGSCRYGIGTGVAERNIEDTRGILRLLGLGEERLGFASFYPDRPSELLGYLTAFRDRIRKLGKTPVDPYRRTKQSALTPETAAPIMAAHNINVCQDCGKCSSACPVALSGKQFSPRAIANAVVAGDLESPCIKEDIWSCLTCGLCYDRCPSAVSFPDFIKEMRNAAPVNGRFEAHEGFFHSLMRAMTSAGPPRKTLEMAPA